MGTYVNNDVASGNVIFAADHNEQGARIAAVLNGGLDDTNISSLSGSKINNGTIPAAALAVSVNPNTLLGETIKAFVQTGCTWSSVSGLNGAMTAGVIYVGPSGVIYRVSINSVSSHGFTASKDTYIDVDSNGTIGYQEVSNGSTSPSLAANSIRVAIVITDGSTITSINQGSMAATAPVVSSNVLTVNDSLGNLIYPTDPVRRLLGFRRITAQFDAGTNALTDVTGLSCPAIVPAGQDIKVVAKGNMKESGSARGMTLLLRESSTTLDAGFVWAGGGAGAGIKDSAEAFLTPSTGLHTYKASIQCDSGANVSLGADPTFPASIRVELL